MMSDEIVLDLISVAVCVSFLEDLFELFAGLIQLFLIAIWVSVFQQAASNFRISLI